MNRGPSAIALGVIAVIVAGTIWLLASGGAEPSTEDPTGDVRVSKGGKAPDATEVADLLEGGARIENGRAIFEARVADDVPRSLRAGAMSWKWEVIEEGVVTWIVSANVDIERTASLVATQFDHSSSTIAGTLPGRLDAEGDTIRVTLELEELEDFPDAFSWTLGTTLDGDRTQASSAVAEDRVPDEGSLDSASN